MASDLTIDALGVHVRLDLAEVSADDAAALAAAWRDALAAPPGDGAGETQIVLPVEPDGDRAWWAPELTRRVTRTAIEVRKGDGWMLHAAGLADESGRVAVLVGRSGAGKTTAARALGRAGLSYVSDDAVLVDAEGVVAAYRKPLSLLTATVPSPKDERSASELGLRAEPAEALGLGALVLLDRREDVAEPVLERVSLEEALPHLVAQSSYLPLLDAPLETVARLVARAGGVHRITYGDAADLAPLVRRALAAPAAEVEAVAVPESEARTDAASDGYRRAPVDDAVVFADSGSIALLYDSALRVLAGVGPTLWRLADGRGATALAAGLVDEHGEPEGGSALDLTADALDELVDAGVLARTGSGVRVRDDVAWVESGRGDVVAVALDDWRRPAAVSLGESGSLIWRVIHGVPGATLDRVLRGVTAEYFVLPDDLEQQVRDFVLALEHRRLVERV